MLRNAAPAAAGRALRSRGVPPLVVAALPPPAQPLPGRSGGAARAVFPSRALLVAAAAASSASDASVPAGGADSAQAVHLASIAKRVAATATRLKQAAWLGFWSQLTLSVVSSVIIFFSIVFKGVTKGTDAGLYFILFGIASSFLSVFWTVGYGRLGDRLRKGVSQPELAPARSQVIHSLTSGATINMVGMGCTVVGLQATTGLLFAKALTAAAQNPYLGGGPGSNPVALDIFLVQAAANALLAHFIGAALSLWLLRSVTD